LCIVYLPSSSCRRHEVWRYGPQRYSNRCRKGCNRVVANRLLYPFRHPYSAGGHYSSLYFVCCLSRANRGIPASQAISADHLAHLVVCCYFRRFSVCAYQSLLLKMQETFLIFFNHLE